MVSFVGIGFILMVALGAVVLIAVVVAIVMGVSGRKTSRSGPVDHKRAPCRGCGNPIDLSAGQCPHCGEAQ